MHHPERKRQRRPAEVSVHPLERRLPNKPRPLKHPPFVGGRAALRPRRPLSKDMRQPALAGGVIRLTNHVMPNAVELFEQVVGREDAEAEELFGAELRLDPPDTLGAIPAGSAIGRMLGAGLLALDPVDGEELLGLVVDAHDEGVTGSKHEAGAARSAVSLACKHSFRRVKTLSAASARDEAGFVGLIEAEPRGVGKHIEPPHAHLAGGLGSELGRKSQGVGDGVREPGRAQEEGVQGDGYFEPIAVGPSVSELAARTESASGEPLHRANVVALKPAAVGG